jgi:hypothetical protein
LPNSSNQPQRTPNAQLHLKSENNGRRGCPICTRTFDPNPAVLSTTITDWSAGSDGIRLLWHDRLQPQPAGLLRFCIAVIEAIPASGEGSLAYYNQDTHTLSATLPKTPQLPRRGDGGDADAPPSLPPRNLKQQRPRGGSSDAAAKVHPPLPPLVCDGMLRATWKHSHSFHIAPNRFAYIYCSLYIAHPLVAFPYCVLCAPLSPSIALQKTTSDGIESTKQVCARLDVVGYLRTCRSSSSHT